MVETDARMPDSNRYPMDGMLNSLMPIVRRMAAAITKYEIPSKILIACGFYFLKTTSVR